MKKTVPFAIAGLSLSFAAGYLANNSKTSEKEVLAPPVAQVEAKSPSRLTTPKPLADSVSTSAQSQYAEQETKQLTPETKKLIDDSMSMQDKMLRKQVTN